MAVAHALLLTDLVGSTQLAEALGDADLAALWTAHDRLARDLLRDWRGREIDKSDGFLLLFSSAADAAGYALAYHRALGSLAVPLQARAGLHVGPVILRENSAADIALGAKPVEVEGLAKPIAARVMSAAQGGQTLLTSEARAALGETDQRLLSHGHWRLQGVSDPIELFEAGDAESPFTPPPDGAKAYRVVRRDDLWLPARQVKHNIPAERDAFVGRHESMLELARRLEKGARLVSVLGMGGTGKTRLVTRFAWTWLGEFPGGAWFCDLSQARAVDGIVHAVADGLDMPLGVEDPVVQLGNAIAGRGECLVILDNFEHLTGFAEETLGRWLSRASAAKFVVTTREVLGLPGEETLVLPPLPPNDAAALFIRRAESVKHGFRPTSEDDTAIATLVKLLDGLPLAIELAAARIRLMSPKLLLARMNERFKLLASTGGRRDRQATLRATFDWSWDLLSARDKAALAQLSVFEGGFTLESAGAVLDLSGHEDASWTLDALQSLVDKSFVRQASEGRFDMLGSVKDYAAEHLRTEGRFEGSGPSALVSAQARHAAYFAALGKERAIADGCIETDNLAAACRRAAMRGDANNALGALEGAWAALSMRGPVATGVALAEEVRAMPDLEPGALAKAELVFGNALTACGKVVEARDQLESALGLARSIGDRNCEAAVLSGLGRLDFDQGRIKEAEAHCHAALPLAIEVADPALEWEVRNQLGYLAEAQGRMGEAETHLQAALDVARRLGDRRREGRTLGNLGVLHLEQGRTERARALYEGALQLAREIGDREWEGNILGNLGLLHQLEGRMQEAMVQLGTALVLSREMGRRHTECLVQCNLGIVHASLDQLGEARARYDAALAVARAVNDRRSEGQVLSYLGQLHSRQGEFAEARQCLDAGERLLKAVSDRFSLGILQCSRAETEHRAGATDAAKAALDEARAVASDLGAGPKSELGLAISRAAELCHSA